MCSCILLRQVIQLHGKQEAARPTSCPVMRTTRCLSAEVLTASEQAPYPLPLLLIQLILSREKSTRLPLYSRSAQVHDDQIVLLQDQDRIRIAEVAVIRTFAEADKADDITFHFQYCGCFAVDHCQTLRRAVSHMFPAPSDSSGGSGCGGGDGRG